MKENLKLSLAQTSEIPQSKGFYGKQLLKGFIHRIALSQYQICLKIKFAY
jgi:hypothetical protein